MADTTAEKNRVLEGAIIEFYRTELCLRYQLDRMRAVRDFDTIPDRMLEDLRDFFLDRLYPAKDVRDELDEAFDHMAQLLHSPARLGPLLRSTLTSVLRLGTHLPAAISAGIATIDALRKTRHLEACMMEVARRIDLAPTDASDRPAMLRLIAEVPEETVKGLINDVILLFEALSNVKMLSGMLHIMERCLSTMEQRPNDYDRDQREGMAFALEVLRGGHSLFAQLKPKDFPHVFAGIRTTELAWYEQVRKQAKQKR